MIFFFLFFKEAFLFTSDMQLSMILTTQKDLFWADSHEVYLDLFSKDVAIGYVYMLREMDNESLNFNSLFGYTLPKSNYLVQEIASSSLVIFE